MWNSDVIFAKTPSTTFSKQTMPSRTSIVVRKQIKKAITQMTLITTILKSSSLLTSFRTIRTLYSYWNLTNIQTSLIRFNCSSITRPRKRKRSRSCSIWASIRTLRIDWMLPWSLWKSIWTWPTIFWDLISSVPPLPSIFSWVKSPNTLITVITIWWWSRITVIIKLPLSKSPMESVAIIWASSTFATK